MGRASSRQALTLIDAMALIVIILVLLGLLIPAMLNSRTPARNMMCSNNFKQLGLSIHNYHSVYKQLPSATFGTASNGQRLSGIVALMPFIEEQEWWEQVANPSTFGGIAYPPMGPDPQDANYELWKYQSPTLRCVVDAEAQGTFGRTNYAFCIGDLASPIHRGAPPDECRGMFAPNVVLRFSDVSDGLANTIAMTEIVTESGRSVTGQFTREQAPQVIEIPVTCFDFVDDRYTAEYRSEFRLDAFGRGGVFADGGAGWTLVQTILPPNGPSCAVGQGPTVDGIFSAGSLHSHGCHVLMGDGAVIFLTDSIDTGDPRKSPPPPSAEGFLETPFGLWGQLGTRAGGEASSLNQ